MTSISPWPFRPTPKSDEILSSYLARIAYAHGLTPYRFYSFHFPGVPLWNRDIDRSASDRLVGEIARHCETDTEQICSMTLRGFESAFRPSETSNKHGVSGISPWINAVGIFHRDRRGYGMQFCPSCLAGDVAFKKSWRLSFVTACSIHNRSLLDCCPHCGRQIIFHRNDSFQPSCHSCGGILTVTSCGQACENGLYERISLQTLLLQIVQVGYAEMPGGATTSLEFFAGLSMLMSAVKSRLRSNRRTIAASEAYADCPTAQIEMLRLNDRVRQCLVLTEILHDWPVRFLEFARSQKLTQRAFDSHIPVPDWLRSAVNEMPLGVTRPRKATVLPIRKTLRNIHRRKAGGWRAERAKILL
ncbi:MAG: TniQ family protein, partial [Gammaproteobacteria bacterium]|nr:TniQ family protein [Gammaproteobacteria bacterium]